MQHHSHFTNHWWLSTNPLRPFFASWKSNSGVISSSVSHIRIVAVQQLRYHVNSCSYLSSPNLAFRSETPPSNRHCKDTFCYLVTDFGKSHLWFRGINTYFVVFKQCNHLFPEWHGCPVFMVAYFQFDGVHVVSGSLDTSIRVWDVESGACRHALMGHQVIIEILLLDKLAFLCLHCDPIANIIILIQSLTSGMELRDNILVSGNADSTVKIWDILTGQCLQTLSGE